MYNEYEVGERLSKVREREGFSQEGLAEKLGCSVITISRWENGQSNMKAADAYHICDALNISADYLLGVKMKRDNQVNLDEAMLEGLSVEQRQIVMATMTAMIAAMKK